MTATKQEKRTVLVTGCSDNGLGTALAIAFHDAGYHVYATARTVTKMQQCAAHGIQTLALDIQSESSLAECVAQVGDRLDILVNNAGAMMTMPVSDTAISQAKEVFDVNVWGTLAAIQAFLPLLIKSKGIIVNNTSISSTLVIPYGGAYGASKAALAMFSDMLRVEIAAFGVRVVDLKTGVVGPTNLGKNERSTPVLPEGSIYAPAKDLVEKGLRREDFEETGMPPAAWARKIVQDLEKKSPPSLIWRGQSALLAWVVTLLPHGLLDGVIKKATHFAEVEEVIKKRYGN
ncbi:hypothetical protein PFICI_07950 [Pestalotiopsis fici W106-1]|uniref:NADPH-dependent 1-acyldihydroxyacetone phosphate reductase n=1 Tax=Pestalotiopsis fici (strain W106-1 / CGMCC3.15140) TaxID=1229662 RepID=W3X5F4_PESFW|nr:uncharacterized protein PFICI_07950 [Pestalotiopsis fici W106-1]ETS80421.1 hypothetical protein PFICI_07950 [Pestalotiopsis fici W106-1]